MATLNEIGAKSLAILRERKIVKQGKTVTNDFLRKLLEETGEAEESLVALLHQVRIGVDQAYAGHSEAGRTYDDLAGELVDIVIMCCATLAFICQDGDEIVADRMRYNALRGDGNS